MPLQRGRLASRARARLRRLASRLGAGGVLDRRRAVHAIARRLLARGPSVPEVEAVLAAGGRSRSMPAVDAQRYVARSVATAVWQG
jgi:hypothetical protein